MPEDPNSKPPHSWKKPDVATYNPGAVGPRDRAVTRAASLSSSSGRDPNGRHYRGRGDRAGHRVLISGFCMCARGLTIQIHT